MMMDNTMCGMTEAMKGFMFWNLLLVSLVLLGFSFIVWVSAKKGDGIESLIGKILSGVLAVVVLVTLFYGTVKIVSSPSGMGMKEPGMGMKKGMGRYMMNKDKMQKMDKKDMENMMENMMEDMMEDMQKSGKTN